MSRSFSTMWPSASMIFIRPPSDRGVRTEEDYSLSPRPVNERRALDHLDDHVDQRRPALVLDQLDRALERGADLIRLGDRSLAGHAERARERGEVDGRIFHLHADQFIFRRTAACDRDLL